MMSWRWRTMMKSMMKMNYNEGDLRNGLISTWSNCLRVSTYAGDIIWGQHFLVVAQAVDEVGVVASLAALRLAVAAVQVHLNLSLPVTLHHCKHQTHRGRTELRNSRGPSTKSMCTCLNHVFIWVRRIQCVLILNSIHAVYMSVQVSTLLHAKP